MKSRKHRKMPEFETIEMAIQAIGLFPEQKKKTS